MKCVWNGACGLGSADGSAGSVFVVSVGGRIRSFKLDSGIRRYSPANLYLFTR